MARIDIEQSEVMRLVVERLRSQLGLGERQCYETVSELSPTIPKGGPYWITVSPGDGVFNEAMQHGGGQQQLMEDSSVLVTAYTQIALDSTDHDVLLLREFERGLLGRKKDVLKTLAQVDLSNEDGDAFLRSYLVARRATKPAYDRDNRVGWVSIEFSILFDWDLS